MIRSAVFCFGASVAALSVVASPVFAQIKAAPKQIIVLEEDKLQLNKTLNDKRLQKLRSVRRNITNDAPPTPPQNNTPRIIIEPNGNRLPIPNIGRPNTDDDNVQMVLQPKRVIAAEPKSVVRRAINETISRSNRIDNVSTLAISLSDKVARATGLDGSHVVMVLQFDELPTKAQRARLAQEGVLIGTFLGGTSYQASIAKRSVSQLIERLAKSDINVRTTSGAVLQATRKIRQTARAAPLPKSKRRTVRKAKPPTPSASGGSPQPVFIEAPTEQSYLIKIAAGQNRQQIKSLMLARGASTVDEIVPGTFLVRDSNTSLDRIAALDSIAVIDTGPPIFQSLVSKGRSVIDIDRMQAMAIDQNQPVFQGVSGQGVRVAVFDTGIDNGHSDFAVALDDATPRFFQTKDGRHRHGTLVAGLIAGNGNETVWADPLAAPFDLRGVAPNSNLGEFNFVLEEETDLAAYAPAYLDHASDVSNHSYVETLFDYGVASEILDSLVHGSIEIDGQRVPAKPQVWAAGNNGSAPLPNYGFRSGYYSVFTQAKNTISVGSIDTDTGYLSEFSSLGPTFDGRIKPDIVAPGCVHSVNDEKIRSTKSGSQDYTSACGTSVAAPFVTGVIALMTEKVRTVTDAPILPSTFKAILVHTAQDQIALAPPPGVTAANSDTGAPTVYHEGPDYATGFGLLNGRAAITKIASLDHWQQDDVSPAENDNERRYCFDVIEGDFEPIRAVIAWDDVPSSASGESLLPKLVNDLDLKLIGPDGQIHLPWTLAPPKVTASLFGPDSDPIAPDDIVGAYRSEDHINNVELVDVDGLIEGRWEIIVRAYQLPNAEAQSFSLVSSHVLSECEE